MEIVDKQVPVVALKEVEVTFRSGPRWARQTVTALSGIDLQIASGETVGLVGESGSGKTTVGRLASGLLKPDNGRIDTPGIAQRRMDPGGVQIVLQHPEWALNPYLRVGRSIQEPLDIRRAGTRSARRKKVAETLELVGLDASMANRYPHELSGGQRQRAAIARALIAEPRLVVFDEAVSALDVSAQAQVLNVIRQTQDARPYASLFISHDLGAVRYVSDRIVVLFHGQVVAEGPAIAFYGRPRHPYAAALVDDTAGVTLGLVETTGSPDACVFAARCPHATEICRSQRPTLRRVGDQMTACHHAEDF